MIPLFIGLHATNLLVLIGVFTLGLLLPDADLSGMNMRSYHMLAGIFAGLFCTLAHMATFTYFMATTKWLGAATDKGNLNPKHFVIPAQSQKSRAFMTCLLAVGITMATMFAGAAADTAVEQGAAATWHLLLATAAVATNFICAGSQFRYIQHRGKLMDQALTILNDQPTPVDEPANFDGHHAVWSRV